MSQEERPVSDGEQRGADEDEERQPDGPEQQLIDGMRQVLGFNNRRGQAIKPSDPGPVAHVIKALVGVPFYPLKVVQVLIQLGYEPNPPERRYSILFRRHLYYYPSIISYAGTIVREKGWGALYQGVGCNFVSDILTTSSRAMIYPFVEGMVLSLPLSVVSGADVPDNEANVESVRSVLIRAFNLFLTRLVSETVVTTIVHPLHVISLRIIAQQIGGEHLYEGITSAASEIYENEGLTGFYAGFAPALLGQTVSIVIYSTLWCLTELIMVSTPNNVMYNWAKLLFKGLVAVPLMAYVPRTYAYPYGMISNVMAVNNSRLAAGAPPRMPIFASWTDCYRHFKSTRSLYRGSVVIFPRFAFKEPPRRAY